MLFAGMKPKNDSNAICDFSSDLCSCDVFLSSNGSLLGRCSGHFRTMN
jgi:hypothetical protein